MEIGCGDEALGIRCFRAVSRVWFVTYMEMFYFYTLLLLHRKPELLPCLFSYPLEVRPLKVHIVGDVYLSHSLGIAFGCAGYESDFDNNADGWYDERCIASLRDACGEKNKRWRPF
jgi:hypothetical protein